VKSGSFFRDKHFLVIPIPAHDLRPRAGFGVSVIAKPITGPNVLNFVSLVGHLLGPQSVFDD
jgi:hypothetical protein